MVLNQKHALLLIALIAANLIFAQESSNEESTSDSDQQTNEGEQSRLFFTRFVACNYTSQAGRTCANCRQTLRCLPSNIGILRTCRGLFRFCNQGVCSWVGGSACGSG